MRNPGQLSCGMFLIPNTQLEFPCGPGDGLIVSSSVRCVHVKYKIKIERGITAAEWVEWGQVVREWCSARCRAVSVGNGRVCAAGVVGIGL